MDTEYGSIQLPLVHPHDKQHDTVDDTFKAAVFGFSDGLTTNINMVLGMAFVQPHSTVVLAGLASLFAGASSMACGEWLSSQAERESERRQLDLESRHLREIPKVEADHMSEILQSCGLSAGTAAAVNCDVARLSPERQLAFHAKFELGIDPDVRKISWKDSVRSAATMWACFCAGALIPLLPWILTERSRLSVIGTVGGSLLGMLGISVYQVRGHHRHLARTFVRQLLVTAVAVGLTILFDALFRT